MVALAMLAALAPAQEQELLAVTAFTVAVGAKVAVAVSPPRQLAELVEWVLPNTAGGHVYAVTGMMPRHRPGHVVPGSPGELGEKWLVGYDVKGATPWKVVRLEAGAWCNGAGYDARTTHVSVRTIGGEPDHTDTNEVLRLDWTSRAQRSLLRLVSDDIGRDAVGIAGHREGPWFRYRWSRDGAAEWVAGVKPDGSFAWLPLPAGTHLQELEWARAASGHWVAFVKGTDRRLLVDPAKDAPVELRGEVALLKKPDRAPGLSLAVSDYAVQSEGASVRSQALWIATDSDPPERALVAHDVQDYWVADDWSWLGYLSKGGLYVCSLELLDADLVRQAREAAARTEALSRAKQVGTGIMIYGADYDERVPPKAGFEDAIRPYLKNDDLLKGFVYLLDGQDLKTLENPHDVEMGYIPIKGGRAVVYADGHAKIVFDKPPG